MREYTFIYISEKELAIASIAFIAHNTLINPITRHGNMLINFIIIFFNFIYGQFHFHT